MTDFAFLQLVLAKSQSVEQAAARYGCSLRTIRSWWQLAPDQRSHCWRQSQAKEA